MMMRPLLVQKTVRSVLVVRQAAVKVNLSANNQ
jgi:hypothetical protein